MANYQVIMRLRPEVREFIRNRRWVHRGDALVYGPNTKSESFSTDAAGFRHSTFKGETLSVAECTQRERYGLVLGSSNLYGFGLAGNENTIPSLLAERFGFPFANVCLPEANSRNLFSLLFALTARAPRLPEVVLLMSGGDFTSFCFTRLADPVFGSPNLKQQKLVIEERGGVLPKKVQIQPLLAFTTLWMRSIGELCNARKIPFILGQDATFFEKGSPSEMDIQAELGVPVSEAQALQFETHKSYVRDYHARRQAVAKSLGAPLVGPDFGHDIGFVDEFHYDKDGTRALVGYFADAVGALL